MNEKPVAQAMFHFIVISMPFTLFSAFFTIIVYCILVFNFFFFLHPFCIYFHSDAIISVRQMLI